MRLGIMQPYFFPNLAHFALIVATNEWIVFDVTQYTRKSWMNRNRILHPGGDWHYISVPVDKCDLQTKTHEVRVSDLRATHKSLLGKLSHYKNAAPFYRRVLELVDRVFTNAADDRLVSLNISGLKEVCALLEIPFKSRSCSEMQFSFPDDMGPGDWAPFICNSLSPESYINPAGGRDLFDPADFTAVGTELIFADFEPFRHDTGPYSFIDGLSILDALMWNTPETLRSVLDTHLRLERAS